MYLIRHGHSKMNLVIDHSKHGSLINVKAFLNAKGDGSLDDACLTDASTPKHDGLKDGFDLAKSLKDLKQKYDSGTINDKTTAAHLLLTNLNGGTVYIATSPLRRAEDTLVEEKIIKNLWQDADVKC